jgi:preprotein translocase subunit SecD
VGITADSDIVFYERIKDNVREGFPVADAVEDAFRHAFRTVLTADTVSLLGAILLWALAVGAVKGFALALGLANVLDIFIFRTYTRRAVGLMAESRFAEGKSFSIEAAAS